jgi:hypothetical protein
MSWRDYGLDGVAFTGIIDYPYELVSGVRENLRIAVMHLADLKEYRCLSRVLVNPGAG